MAGCATPTGSAGYAGAPANLKLTFHLDHSAGADQSCLVGGSVDREARRMLTCQPVRHRQGSNLLADHKTSGVRPGLVALHLAISCHATLKLGTSASDEGVVIVVMALLSFADSTPKPNGSRSATPPSLIQQWPGQPRRLVLRLHNDFSQIVIC